MLTTALFLGFLVLTALLASGSGWSDVLSTQRNELVFADRNQAYGAYQLRREQGRTLLLSLVTALGTVSAILFLPGLFADHTIPVPGPSVAVDVVIDPVVAPVVAPKVTPTTATPRPPAAPRPSSGPLLAVDSIPHTPVDTMTKTTDTSLTPGSGDKGGPGTTIPGDGGTHRGAGDGGDIKNGWELESMPEYPGGDKALYAYLGREVRYPDIDIDARREGRVMVGFIIRADGSVTDVQVLQGISPTLDAEATRVVRKMIKWIPGRFNQRKVDVRYALPIVFKLARN
jgi:protein TonB